MSDGTTGIQVAPIPTESEMASIRQIFTNVANALVRASELATQVTELEGRLNKLDTDYTAVMARNDELVLSLNEVRLQRDTAQQVMRETTDQLRVSQAEAKANADGWNEAKNMIEDLRSRLNQTSNDYNEAMNSWHSAEAQLDEAKAGLAKVKSALGIVDPPKAEIASQTEPTPQPSPTEVGQEVAHTYPSDAGPQAEADQPKPHPYAWDPNKF